jgi:hypothetical protein
MAEICLTYVFICEFLKYSLEESNGVCAYV